MKYLLIIIVFLLLFTVRPVSLEKITMQNKDSFQVEVKGHLQNPGIYDIDKGTTIGDFIATLKLKENSDISHYNLNDLLLDHDVLVIKEKTIQAKISINAATKEELMQLKGIKEKMAIRIIDYRNQQRFNKLEDLMNVKGIGEKTFQKLVDFITL